MQIQLVQIQQVQRAMHRYITGRNRSNAKENIIQIQQFDRYNKCSTDSII